MFNNKCWYCGKEEFITPEPKDHYGITEDLCEDCGILHGLMEDVAEQLQIDSAWDNPCPVLPHERSN